MQVPELVHNSDFTRKAIITILGIIMVSGAFWAAYQVDSPSTSSERNDNQILATPTIESQDMSIMKVSTYATPDGNLGDSHDIFENTYFGYKVLCGTLNTGNYGNPGTVEETLPIFNSASQIFKAMGDRVDLTTDVMVVKGTELTFRDSKPGLEYTQDANSTDYCLLKK